MRNEQRQLSPILQNVWPLIVEVVKVHDTWECPLPKPLRCGHMRTVPDKIDRFAEAVAEIGLDGAREMFKGHNLRIGYSAEQVSRAERLMLRFKNLNYDQRASIIACARGRPFHKLSYHRWRALQEGIMALLPMDLAA